MSPSLTSTPPPMAYNPHHYQGTPPPPPTAASANPLAAIYASYVVRVHTRHGIKTLSFDLLASFFTLTAKKAAEDLGISSRTLIRVCRSLGIRRWPYLGFRSEKNVERIRHEAIENLRRKLEKEGASASPTAMLFPNASSLRGASAKRLLQVKLPQEGGHMSSPLPSGQSWSVQSIDDTESDEDTDVEMMETRPSISESIASQPLPLLTPQPTHSGFNLEVRSISPKKPLFSIAQAATHFQQQRQQSQHEGVWVQKMPHLSQLPSRAFSPFQKQHSTPSPASSFRSNFTMPSLNLLVDASILTAFKHDSHNQHFAPPQQQQQSPRSMSMRDILSNTAMAA
ncbi:Winged helix-turn-helix dna-binding domain [Globisporangium polare]